MIFGGIEAVVVVVLVVEVEGAGHCCCWGARIDVVSSSCSAAVASDRSIMELRVRRVQEEEVLVTEVSAMALI